MQPKRRPARVVASKREGEDGKIESNVSLHREGAFGHCGHDASEHGEAHADPEGSSHDGEQKAFREQLGEDGSWCGAERSANRQLLLPRHASCQQKICNVDAGDEQDEDDSAEKEPERGGTVAGNDVIPERIDCGSPAFVALGIILGDVGGDRGHVCLRLLNGNSRFETANHQQPVKVVIDLFRREDERNGKLRGFAVGDTGCDDADDCVRFVVQANRLADDFGVGAEFFPEAVCEKDNVVLARPAFFGKEIASEREGVTHHGRHAGSDSRSGNDLRLIACGEIEVCAGEGVYVLEDLAVSLPVGEVAGRDAVMPFVESSTRPTRADWGRCREEGPEEWHSRQ